MNQGAAFCDGIAANLMEIISKADGDAPVQDELERATRELDMDDRRGGASSRSVGSSPERATAKGTKSPNNLVNFQKTWMYLNSRLPPYMAPWHVFLPTWTLVCRAAQASIDVYKRPTADERSYYTAADPKQGTKAMVVRSQPIDGRKLVTIAVRGSKWNLVDWTVNFAINPTEPFGFLDDPGNACHAGFLEVARAMLPTVAALLRQMVKDDSSIASGSLLFTGHSAGGAVASLLYAHMLARTVESELTVLAGLFRRVHCVTFGAPPVSLLPLQVPRRSPHDRNQFLSFINEGDLVVRADRAYLLSLIKLFTAPAPATKSNRSRLRKKLTQEHLKGAAIGTPSGAAPYWPVPEALLSNAGHLVLLRETPYTANHAPEAVPISDQQLRNVVFGDPAMHPMVLYKRRVDQLAFAAVSGNEPG
ncbi:hypothetical protein B0A50_00105 [Salinomyces thailandicus]|uniref:Fungal lipase-type domain-containing protein n=1 Tax=Salinomyces thailandicus TaxID=706561 RepID=A0A4U0UHT6_9PEZI|nr:hypothetical protein B0A50_00105 [Salinomyces thailandica]